MTWDPFYFISLEHRIVMHIFAIHACDSVSHWEGTRCNVVTNVVWIASHVTPVCDFERMCFISAAILELSHATHSSVFTAMSSFKARSRSTVLWKHCTALFSVCVLTLCILKHCVLPPLGLCVAESEGSGWIACRTGYEVVRRERGMREGERDSWIAVIV